MLKSKLASVLALLVAVALSIPALGGNAAAIDERHAASFTSQPATAQLALPHPLLSDIRMRRALAFCSDRPALAASVFPFLNQAERNSLLMDTFLPKAHWAYAAPPDEYAYAYDPAKGKALLEAAGWTQAQGEPYRTNPQGYQLAVGLTTSNAGFRQTWVAEWEAQLKACGIRLVRNHLPAAWFFGDETGLARRDFETAGFAWVGEAEPGARTLYACDQIPTAGNNWQGQNYMGWCNPLASQAIIAATNTLARVDRTPQYATVQQEFAKDMVSLPVFQRVEIEAWSNAMGGVKSSPTEYITKSAAQWTKTGASKAVLAWTEQPASLLLLSGSGGVARMAADLGIGVVNTAFDYDYQAGLQDPLSKIENGLAANATVSVGAGDLIYTVEGQRAALAAGVRVVNVAGEVVVYGGSGSIEMKQLTATYRFKPYTWSDGHSGSIEDFRLAARASCDPAAAGWRAVLCDRYQDIQWGPGLEYTVKWLPGAQDPLYYLAPFGGDNGPYPSHQVLSDGRSLADVPPAEWQNLPELVRSPLSYGPFQLAEWTDAHMVFVRNPYYQPAAKLATIEVKFVDWSYDLVGDLLAGNLDLVDKMGLGGGAAAQQAVDASHQGLLQASVLPSPTWEHVDFNLDLYAQVVAKTFGSGGGEIRNDLGLAVTVPAGPLAVGPTLILNTRPSSHPGPVRQVESFTLDARDANEDPLSVLAQNVTITYDYQEADVAKAGVTEDALNIWAWKDGRWQALLPCTGCGVDKSANRITARTDLATDFLIGGAYRIYLPALRG